jgi:energy-coupling factor transport system permease protein
VLIHCISFDGVPYFDQKGLLVAGKIFLRIGSFMIAFLWIIRTCRPEELYALSIDLRVPVPVIYLVFKIIYFLQKIGEKAKEILTAQQARGFMLKGIRNRFKALILILIPLFSTTIYELEENSAAIVARGLYAPGRKSHLIKIKFTYLDVLTIVTLTIIICSVLLISKI